VEQVNGQHELFLENTCNLAIHNKEVYQDGI
jgi:hypothetical protein